MHNHRVNELLELLKPYWLKEPTLSLTQTLQKIAAEAGSEVPLAEPSVQTRMVLIIVLPSSCNSRTWGKFCRELRCGGVSSEQ